MGQAVFKVTHRAKANCDEIAAVIVYFDKHEVQCCCP
jgi:hypothetical protein